jgi:hypothetical protein
MAFRNGIGLDRMGQIPLAFFLRFILPSNLRIIIFRYVFVHCAQTVLAAFLLLLATCSLQRRRYTNMLGYLMVSHNTCWKPIHLHSSTDNYSPHQPAAQYP